MQAIILAFNSTHIQQFTTFAHILFQETKLRMSEFLDQVKARLSRSLSMGFHHCKFNDRQYEIFADVFSPQINASTFWETRMLIKHLQSPSSFLEIGVGAGVTLAQVILYYKCAFAMGTDISYRSVLNTQANLEKYGLEAIVICSDVLDNVPQHLKFDAIYWNFPCVCTKGNQLQLSMAEKMVIDPNYANLQKLLQGGKQHLSPNGMIFLGFSHTSGSEVRLKALCDLHDWTYHVLELKETISQSRVHSVSLLKLIPKILSK